jgi:hypothetical protein
MMKMARKTPTKTKSTRVTPRGTIRRATKTPQKNGTIIYAAIRRISKTLGMPKDKRDLVINRKLLTEGEPVKAAIFGISEYRADIIVLSEQPARTRDVKFIFSPSGKVNPQKFMLDYVKTITKMDGIIWYYVTPTLTRKISAQHARDLAEDWADAGKRLVASL